MNKLNILIKVALSIDDLSDETHIESDLKNALIARGNNRPNVLTPAEKDLYNKLILSDKDKKYNNIRARIRMSRFGTNHSKALRNMYAINNNPDPIEPIPDERVMKQMLINRNKDGNIHGFAIGKNPTVMEMKAYQKLKSTLKPDEDIESNVSFITKMKNLDYGKRLLFAKHILKNDDNKININDYVRHKTEMPKTYRKALIGRGNRNPKSLSKIEKKVYDNMKLSPEQKNKGYLLQRILSSSPYVDVSGGLIRDSLKDIRDNFAYSELNELKNKKN